MDPAQRVTPDHPRELIRACDEARPPRPSPPAAYREPSCHPGSPESRVPCKAKTQGVVLTQSHRAHYELAHLLRRTAPPRGLGAASPHGPLSAAAGAAGLLGTPARPAYPELRLRSQARAGLRSDSPSRWRQRRATLKEPRTPRPGHSSRRNAALPEPPRRGRARAGAYQAWHGSEARRIPPPGHVVPLHRSPRLCPSLPGRRCARAAFAEAGRDRARRASSTVLWAACGLRRRLGAESAGYGDHSARDEGLRKPRAILGGRAAERWLVSRAVGRVSGAAGSTRRPRN